MASKRVKFTARDLEVMQITLRDVLNQMQGDLATTAQMAEVIMPLIKIDQLMKREASK